jgi:hypothetical protein
MTTTRKYTISEIRAANKGAGLHFFSPSTMRFFSSKVERTVYQGDGGVFFVTSEQFVGSDGIAQPRAYKVRSFDPTTSDVRTARGEFRHLDDARDEAKRLAEGGTSRDD